MRKSNKPCCGRSIPNMTKHHRVKSCCGRSNLILEATKAIRKHQVSVFEAAGYIAPQSHKDIGIFYIRGNGIVATAPYGGRRITVYCSDRDCDARIADFEKILEIAVSS